MKKCNQCSYQFDNEDWQCPTCNFKPNFIDGYLSFAPELAQENEGFEAYYFDSLAKLEAKNFWFCNRNRLIIWAFNKYFKQAKNFLEIGCGTGFVLSGIENEFPHLNVYGSEIFTNGLNFASQRLKQAQIFQMDARKIPFKNEFDVIGAFDVIEHIQEDDQVLEQMFNATKSDGGIMITVPQHRWLWSQADEYAHHVRRYTAKELKNKVAAAGFKVVKMTSFVSLLLPLMIVSRLKPKKVNQQFDILSEFKISPFLNNILELILKIELFLIKMNISFPWGGSLLLIAKKN